MAAPRLPAVYRSYGQYPDLNNTLKEGRFGEHRNLALTLSNIYPRALDITGNTVQGRVVILDLRRRIGRDLAYFAACPELLTYMKYTNSYNFAIINENTHYTVMELIGHGVGAFPVDIETSFYENGRAFSFLEGCNEKQTKHKQRALAELYKHHGYSVNQANANCYHFFGDFGPTDQILEPYMHKELGHWSQRAIPFSKPEHPPFSKSELMASRARSLSLIDAAAVGADDVDADDVDADDVDADDVDEDDQPASPVPKAKKQQAAGRRTYSTRRSGVPLQPFKKEPEARPARGLRKVKTGAVEKKRHYKLQPSSDWIEGVDLKFWQEKIWEPRLVHSVEKFQEWQEKRGIGSARGNKAWNLLKNGPNWPRARIYEYYEDFKDIEPNTKVSCYTREENKARLLAAAGGEDAADESDHESDTDDDENDAKPARKSVSAEGAAELADSLVEAVETASGAAARDADMMATKVHVDYPIAGNAQALF